MGLAWRKDKGTPEKASASKFKKSLSEANAERDQEIVNELLSKTVIVKIADSNLLNQPSALVEAHDGSTLLDLAMASVEKLHKRAPKLKILLAQDASTHASTRQAVLTSVTNKKEAILTSKDEVLLRPRPCLDFNTKGAAQVIHKRNLIQKKT